MRSFTQQHEQQVMEGRMGSLEQAVQALTARMTEVFEMLSARDRRDAVENGRRRLRAGEGEEFLAYKEEASKRMEEIRKRMESFSPPRTSPTSQSLPITGESNAGSVGTNFMPHIINIKPTEDVTMSPEFSGDISSPDGRVVKEGVAGILVAASPVQFGVNSKVLPSNQLEPKLKKPKNGSGWPREFLSLYRKYQGGVAAECEEERRREEAWVGRAWNNVYKTRTETD